MRVGIGIGGGGIMQWAVQGSARHIQVFRMLEQFHPTPVMVIFEGGKLKVINEPSPIVGRNVIPGLQEVRYRVQTGVGAGSGSGSAPGSDIDLGLFDFRGNLLRRLSKSPAQVGFHAVSIENAGPRAVRPGAYIVKLSQGAAIHSAVAHLVP